MSKPPVNNIVTFPGTTVLAYPVGQFLRQLADAADEKDDFASVLVIAMRRNSPPTIHASMCDTERNLSLATLAAQYLTGHYASMLHKGFGPDNDSEPPEPAAA